MLVTTLNILGKKTADECDSNSLPIGIILRLANLISISTDFFIRKNTYI